MLIDDVYLQRSQGKEETGKENKGGKRVVGNRSCGHGSGAEEAGWQVARGVGGERSQQGRQKWQRTASI